MQINYFVFSVMIFCFFGSCSQDKNGSTETHEISNAISYEIADTKGKEFYNASSFITSSKPGGTFHEQDGNYSGYEVLYANNVDESIIEIVTGEMWIQSLDEIITFCQSFEKAENSHFRSIQMDGHAP